MPQMPYSLEITVTLNGSAKRGAEVWAQDITEGTFKAYLENVSVVRTDVAGHAIIALENITSSYANGDTIVVYCKCGDVLKKTTTTVDTTVGASSITFAFVSAMQDGLDNSLDADEKYGLKSLGYGMKRGLKDGLN